MASRINQILVGAKENKKDKRVEKNYNQKVAALGKLWLRMKSSGKATARRIALVNDALASYSQEQFEQNGDEFPLVCQWDLEKERPVVPDDDCLPPRQPRRASVSSEEQEEEILEPELPYSHAIAEALSKRSKFYEMKMEMIAKKQHGMNALDKDVCSVEGCMCQFTRRELLDSAIPLTGVCPFCDHPVAYHPS